MNTRKTFAFLLSLSFASLAVAQQSGPYNLTWNSIEAGATSNGGGFELRGTSGQPDAQAVAAFDLALGGGFWVDPCLGSVKSYGQGCLGSGGFTPQMSVTGCPARGASIHVGLDDTLGGAPALILYGIQQANLGYGAGCSMLDARVRSNSSTAR